MLKEFKEFALKGNAVDMAVGIVVGAAFGKIVTSLVGDILMPPLGLLLGRMDFSSLAIHLNKTTAVRYGVFINNVVDFVIVAFVIFLAVKQINRLRDGRRPPIRRRKSARSAARRFRSMRPAARNCTSALSAAK